MLRISNADARRLFLHAQGLSADPSARLDMAGLQAMIEGMGFVQLDSVKAVERAHHHILFARNQRYRPDMLHALAERRRSLFEHWTHDASLIPTRWYGHWHHRFTKFKRHIEQSPGWRRRLGDDVRVIDAVRKRIDQDGPLEARAFAGDSARTGPWWGWSAHKAALEFLWFTGELAVAGRAGFRKIYDLAERVIPDHGMHKPPAAGAHRDWSARTALDRLGFATPTEIAGFWDAMDRKQAETWCAGEMGRHLIAAGLEDASGRWWRGYVVPSDIEARLAAAPEPPRRVRLISPFDPLIRNRQRTERLFGFSYRIEIFVPAAKRQYGYYVFPVLEGDRFIARADLNADAKTGVLEVRGFWPEPGVRWGKGRIAAMAAELERVAAFAGARGVSWPKRLRP